jgi:phosphatidylinositol alpha-1,6-mannosyltransferase
MSAAERYKGHDQLIDAWPQVHAAVPGAQLVVAGGGDDALRLERKAQSLGLGDRVLFAGRVSDATAARLYATVRGFAMPSRGEGFGLVYLEAMRAGLPCIASPDDGGADVVVDRETGWLVPQGDGAGLVRALTSMVRDVERSRQLGAAGRRRFEREYTFDAFRRRFARVMEMAFAERLVDAACAG